MSKEFHLQTPLIQARIRAHNTAGQLNGLLPDTSFSLPTNHMLIFPATCVEQELIDAIRNGIAKFCSEIGVETPIIKQDTTRFYHTDTKQFFSCTDEALHATQQNNVIVDPKKLIERVNFYRQYVQHRGIAAFVFPHTWENQDMIGFARYPNIFLSTGTTRKFEDDHLETLSIVTAHEMGHIYGLTSRNFNTHADDHHLHCGNENCLMFPTIEREKIRKIIDRASWLCSDCHDNIAFIREKLSEKGIIL